MSLAEFWRIAIHESGHTVARAKLSRRWGSVVTIIPRGETLGTANSEGTGFSNDPEVQRYHVIEYMAGYAAELELLGQPERDPSETGAASDFEHAAELIDAFGLDRSALWSQAREFVRDNAPDIRRIAGVLMRFGNVEALDLEFFMAPEYDAELEATYIARCLSVAPGWVPLEPPQ